MNRTLDGFCDHIAIIPDDEIHQYYNGVLKTGDDIIYRRITYQLMEYWPTVVENPMPLYVKLKLGVRMVLSWLFCRSLQFPTECI